MSAAKLLRGTDLCYRVAPLHAGAACRGKLVINLADQA